MEELRYCLRGANVESNHPLIVSVLTCSKEQRERLQKLLERLASRG